MKCGRVSKTDGERPVSVSQTRDASITVIKCSYPSFSLQREIVMKKGQIVPDCFEACSYFDGDIEPLQTMLNEAYEAWEDAEKIVQNKHAAASTCRKAPINPVLYR